jgi:hypothetical protein
MTEGYELAPPHWNVFQLGQQSTSSSEYDAIFVLAGGLNDRMEIHPWVQNRLDLALSLYRQSKRPVPIVCLGGGTYHKPAPTNEYGHVIHESTACAQYLVSQGVPCENVYKEWASYDTIANGWFAFQDFIVPLKWSRMAVVTSHFHMPRTRAIFEHMRRLHGDVSLDFVGTDDGFEDPDVARVRYAREKNSLRKYLDSVNNITSLREFHWWFYTQHACYNARPRPPADTVDNTLQRSY